VNLKAKNNWLHKMIQKNSCLEHLQTWKQQKANGNRQSSYDLIKEERQFEGDGHTDDFFKDSVHY